MRIYISLSLISKAGVIHTMMECYPIFSSFFVFRMEVSFLDRMDPVSRFVFGL
jgi:hypothetical protein